MTHGSRALLMWVALIFLLTVALCACTTEITETIEVTRFKILERRVIEKVLVTVEVTRIHPVTVTPRPTRADLVPRTTSETPEPSPSTPTVTPTPRPTQAATAPPAASEVAESLLTALRDTEQTLLSLVQALNSDPLPIDNTIELYDALSGAPTFTIPEDQAELQSIYIRYREQIENVLNQGADLYAHLTQIQSGEADQTEVSPIHLSLARDAASDGTSTIQALIRELEAFLASQP